MNTLNKKGLAQATKPHQKGVSNPTSKKGQQPPKHRKGG